MIIVSFFHTPLIFLLILLLLLDDTPLIDCRHDADYIHARYDAFRLLTPMPFRQRLLFRYFTRFFLLRQ